MLKARSRVLGILVLAASVPIAVGSVAAAARADDYPGVLDVLPTATADPTSSPSEPTPTHSAPTSSETPPPSPSATSGPAMFEAADGHSYPAGAGVVKSKDKGELFFGEDFDSACYDGPYFEKGLRGLTRLAKLIDSSGREVVVVTPPNKSAVDAARLEGVRLPHGRCAKRGLAAQRHLLETFGGKHFLPVLPALEASDERVYWRSDTHWNPLGAAIFAKRLASRLDEKVGRAYAWRSTTARRWGDMKYPYGAGPREKSNGAQPTTKVRVRPAPGSPDIDLDHPVFEYRWTSSPSRRVIPGRTALVGDSYTYLGLTQLLPLFADGHFMWTGVVSTDQLVQGIVDSDTVVLEVVQRLVARSDLTSAEFREAVASALAAHPRTS